MKGVEAGPWFWSMSGSFPIVVTDSLGFISRLLVKLTSSARKFCT